MSITTYDPRTTYTLAEEVSAGKNTAFSHSEFQFKVKNDDVIIPYASIFSKYHHILTPYIITTTLNDYDFHRYYQKPKLMSDELYGTPELWSALMYINNIVSVANFTKRRLKVFNTNIVDIIQEIMTIYNDDLTNNKNEVYNE